MADFVEDMLGIVFNRAVLLCTFAVAFNLGLMIGVTMGLVS